ncbi:MAG: cytochrome-c oxidase, partial [Haloarculaceae archaeon]
GMPRRYATYEFDAAIAPLAQITSLHQIATVGAVVLALGQLIWLWNMIQSYYEGPVVQDGDPWDLKDDGMFGREFQWFESQLQQTMADGGEEESEETVLADGGEVDGELTPAIRRVDDE